MFRFIYILVAFACIFFTLNYIQREKVDDKIAAIILLVEIATFIIIENKLFID